MKDFFENSKSNWVCYKGYELKEKDGVLYITPSENAMPDLYNIMQCREQIIVDALNTGLLCMKKSVDEGKKQKAVMKFVSHYGLLGLMTTITSTPAFMDYEVVHFIKNRFIKAETMDTLEYIAKFFPFEMPQITKNGLAMRWDISGDKTMMALAMTFSDRETAVNMSLQRNYAEPYEWVKTQLIDWALLFTTAHIFYEDDLSEDDKTLYRQMMTVFDSNSPTYHIALRDDKPVLVWNFGSLAIAVQMLFSLSITDDKKPIRVCKQCAKAFISPRPNAVFCSSKCKNQYNVYKSRNKNNS